MFTCPTWTVIRYCSVHRRPPGHSGRRFNRLEIVRVTDHAEGMQYRFADCELDTDAFALTRGGRSVHVEPQVFDLLVMLAEAQGELVSYDQLVERVWHGRIVSDATIAARISSARSAVGDDGKRQAVIRTVSRRGLQMAVSVERAGTRAQRTNSNDTRDARRQTIRYTASRDGTSIAYASIGDGPPLLRGGHWLSHLEQDWNSPIWRPMLERLSRQRRLVRYDPRGTGLSTHEFGNPGIEDFVDDMEAVANAAGLERFPIFAASQSAPIALAFAARHPERVSRLVLINGFARGSSALGEHEKTETMVGLIQSGWGIPDSAFMKAFATIFVPTATAEELDSLIEMQKLSASADTAARLRRIIGAIDVSELLQRVTAPTLVLHSTGDSIQPLCQGQYLAQHLPNAELQLIDSSNHVSLPSDPAFEQICSEIERFLDADLS